MLTIAALLAFGLPQGTTPPPKPAPEAVVATVDGAPITAADVEAYLWAWKSREVVTEIASHRMVAAEAARKSIVVTDAEVKTKIDEQLAALKGNVPAGQTVEAFLQEKVGGMSHLALIARTALLVEKIAASEFQPEKYVKVSTLVFRTNGDTTDALTKAIKKADAAHAALQAGKPWADVVRLYEEDARIVANQGLVGWKAYDAFPESVRAQLSTLKPMGFTKPTQTPNGIQIFRMNVRGAEATPADLGELKSQYILGSRQSVVQRLREKAKIEIK